MSIDVHHDLMEIEFDTVNRKLTDIQQKLDTLVQQNDEPDKDAVIEGLQQQVNKLEAGLRCNEEFTERKIKEARETRLLDLLKPLMQTAWRLDVRNEYALPKCPLCDDGRKRHYKSPSGRQMVEDCSCSRKRSVYFVEEVDGIALDARLDGGYDYFFVPMTWRDRKEGERLAEIRRQDVYKGETFSSLYKKTMQFRVVFFDRGTAEKFAEWMNNKDEQKEPNND